MARLSSQSNTCDCRNQYMISDHSSDSKGIIAGWQTDLEVRTRWKWWTLWRRNSTQHYTFSMAALIKAWSSAETTQQRERVRYKRPVFLLQWHLPFHCRPGTQTYRAFVFFYLILQDVNEYCWLWVQWYSGPTALWSLRSLLICCIVTSIQNISVQGLQCVINFPCQQFCGTDWTKVCD